MRSQHVRATFSDCGPEGPGPRDVPLWFAATLPSEAARLWAGPLAERGGPTPARAHPHRVEISFGLRDGERGGGCEEGKEVQGNRTHAPRAGDSK